MPRPRNFCLARSKGCMHFCLARSPSLSNGGVWINLDGKSEGWYLLLSSANTPWNPTFSINAYLRLSPMTAARRSKRCHAGMTHTTQKTWGTSAATAPLRMGERPPVP
ncbi:hypothetical protein PVAP13_2KG203301 [Panicum virgatum]|uniref:Uncharacterized protein n=1 Tax=Panicum virgatum TaxID=38727 RepID=A0A8T0WAS3_PANVG|nr:hypothetical protein PVAP13_2KG203301 [Panicum virgatum]